MSNLLWAEPGTSPTQGFELYGSTVGTVTSDATTLILGQRSIKCDATASALEASVIRNQTFTTGRVSFRIAIGTAPTAGVQYILRTRSTSTAMAIVVDLNRKLSLYTSGAVSLAGPGSTVLALGTVYRLTLSFSITSTTVYEGRIFIDDATTPEVTVSNGTALAVATVTAVRMGLDGGNANVVFNVGQLVIDDGAGLDNPGDYRCTHKGPDTVNLQDAAWTALGTGAVNERPISTTNGRTVAGDATTGEDTYTVQAASVGDVDVTGWTIVGHYGWVWAAKGAGAGSPTDNIKLGGINSAVTLTTTPAAFQTAAVTSATYPTTVGMSRTVGALPDALFYEAGVVLAYLYVGAPAEAVVWDFPELTVPVLADLLVLVDDVPGTPILKKTLLSDFATALTFGQVVVQVKSVGSGTYTPTAGMKKVLVIGVGGGGAGAGGVNTDSAGGGGGGGGACIRLLTAADIGASKAYVVGAADAATTLDTAGALLNAGAGGTGVAGATFSVVGVQTAGGTGGTAANGDLNIPGQPGEHGVIYSATDGHGGDGGSSLLGAGGISGGTNVAGATPGEYGGGGSGGHAAAATNRDGAPGAPGILYLIEMLSA